MNTATRETDKTNHTWSHSGVMGHWRPGILIWSILLGACWVSGLAMAFAYTKIW